MTPRSQEVSTNFFQGFQRMANGVEKKNIPARLELSLYEEMREAVFHRRTTFQAAIEEGLRLWLGKADGIRPQELAADTDGVMSELDSAQRDLVRRYADALRAGSNPEHLGIIQTVLGLIEFDRRIPKRQSTG